MSPSTPRKRFSASIFLPISAAAALWLCTLPTGAGSAGSYYDLIYDYEVASFCGLIGKDVYDAFWEKRRAMEAAAEASADVLTRIRIGAMADADREYQNRGLGGYKPWCGSDGMAGVRRLLGK